MSVKRYLVLSFVVTIASVLAVLGIGLWISVSTGLHDYLHHLRQVTHHHPHAHPPLAPYPSGQAHMGLTAIDHFLRSMEVNLVLTALIAIITGLAVALYIARSLSRPLQTLTQGAHAITRGVTNIEISPSDLDELDALSAAFNNLAANLKEADSERTERLEDLSHEIRTPLTALLGYTEALTDKEVSSRIHDEITRIRRLAEHLPESAPIASYLYRMAPHRAVDVIEPVAALYTPLMTARHITCECQYSKSDLWLQCDQQALREALHNLLANSLKHTPDQGVIRLTVQPAEISRYALLIVEDSGPGIPDHLRDAIWQRRVSLHTHTGG